MLKTYTGEVIPAEGVFIVIVKNKQRAKLPLYVVQGSSPPHFGREWLRKIRIDWREIKTVREETLEGVLQRHAEVFKKELGTLKGMEVAIALKPDYVPRFCQARVVPYALRPKVEVEIERLCDQGIISPVKFSEWATPIVPVVKKNGDVRICGDFKVTINPALCVEKYPIPRIEDLFASLSGGQQFSKLDLSHAYLQMVIEKNSRKCLTITTSKGLFIYNRLPFGVTSAPAIFQRAMDQVLQGLPNVHCYLDDILASGQDHFQTLPLLDAVLGRLEEFGLRVQKEKCKFFKDSLEYLGHVIDAQGLHKAPEKVRAIVEAPAPTDVSQLRSFLGYLSCTTPVNSQEICRESRGDPVLAQVLDMVSTGRFPRVQDAASTLSPFISRKGELTLQQGCLMWGVRVIIPSKLRSRVLSELHTGHAGVVKMKAVARSYMWWPGIDAQIEQVSKTCQSCQLTQKAPGPAPLHPWTWPGSPWQRIHVDFAGPFQGQMFMVVVDAHSKWPEVHLMTSTTTTKTIQVLRGLFSRYGLPEVLVSDNGPQFTSHEFDSFMKGNGVKHI
ncbi:uncharacterized protein K02A2.6-like [Cololabis saira]|uniref:uncharacterized protein K02A2.6-like n=1 Tax=Cololabis saira TaxID=129043 RepID=UPI002AD4D18A|nr:uncharacterized protein K02A2.6-like [Cololabis saira]